MSTLNIAPWQFGITTVHHVFLAALTIGLAFIAADLRDLIRHVTARTPFAHHDVSAPATISATLPVSTNRHDLDDQARQ